MMHDLYIQTLVAVFILRLNQILLRLFMVPTAIPIRRLTSAELNKLVHALNDDTTNRHQPIGWFWIFF